MKADIICIGTEYITGMLPENTTNYLAGRMAELDVNVRRIVIVGSYEEEIRKALDDSYQDVDTVLLTGGIGYGRSQDIFADYFGKKLIFSEDAFTHMKKQVEKSVIRMDDTQLKGLAEIPEGAMIFDNYDGYVPGYVLESVEKTLIVLPFLSTDIKAIFEDDIVGYFYKRVSIGNAGMKIILNEKAEEKGIRGLLSSLGDLCKSENPSLDIVKEENNYVLKIRAVGPTNGDAMILANLFTSDCCQKLGSECILNIKEDTI